MLAFLSSKVQTSVRRSHHFRFQSQLGGNLICQASGVQSSLLLVLVLVLVLVLAGNTAVAHLPGMRLLGCSVLRLQHRGTQAG